MVTLEFAHALPTDVPHELAVYATAVPRRSQPGMLALARRWRPHDAAARPPEFTRFDGWTVLRHGPAIVALNRRSGAVRLLDDERYGRPPAASLAVPSPRLVEIARQFVDDIGLLATPARELTVGRIVYSRLQAMSTTGEVMPEQVVDAGVVFTREIDGVPVAGPGGHLTAHIVDDESVVACVKVWRDITGRAGTVRVRPPDHGVEELRRRLARRGIDGTVRVLRAQFGYFEAGAVDPQRYLEPAYAFVFDTIVAGGTYKSVEIVPAVDQPRQRWRHPRRRPAPEVLPERPRVSPGAS